MCELTIETFLKIISFLCLQDHYSPIVDWHISFYYYPFLSVILLLLYNLDLVFLFYPCYHVSRPTQSKSLWPWLSTKINVFILHYIGSSHQTRGDFMMLYHEVASTSVGRRHCVVSLLVGWLVVLGLTALWDSISVYIGPSPKEREKEERKDRCE